MWEGGRTGGRGGRRKAGRGTLYCRVAAVGQYSDWNGLRIGDWRYLVCTSSSLPGRRGGHPNAASLSPSPPAPGSHVSRLIFNNFSSICFFLISTEAISKDAS